MWLTKSIWETITDLTLKSERTLSIKNETHAIKIISKINHSIALHALNAILRWSAFHFMYLSVIIENKSNLRMRESNLGTNKIFYFESFVFL